MLTPTLLSGLQLLSLALESTSKPIGVLTFEKKATQQMLAGHAGFDRFRVVGLDHVPTWAQFRNPDRYVKELQPPEQLRKELVEDCRRERESGAFKDIGGLVLECAATPQFRSDLVEVLGVPVWDVGAFAKAMLGA